MNRWRWTGGLRRALITTVRVSRSPIRGQQCSWAARAAAVHAEHVWNICAARWQRSVVARRVFTVKFYRVIVQLICHRISDAAAFICCFSSFLFSLQLLSFFLCFITPRPPPAATETQFPTLARFVSSTPYWTRLCTYRYHLVLRIIKMGGRSGRTRLSGAPRTRIHPHLVVLYMLSGHGSARS